MRPLHIAAALLGLALGTAAHAQLPFQPEPGFNDRPQCTKHYVRSVADQVAFLEKLQTAGPKAVGRLCSLIEMGDAWLGSEGAEGLRSWLGLDNVDLERVAAKCRAGQDSVARELRHELARLRLELLRCDDTI
jgi:hypothetical protein